MGALRCWDAWTVSHQRIRICSLPRLHTHLSNLRATLRDSGSLRGWGDPYGYLPDEHRFYYLTNAPTRD